MSRKHFRSTWLTFLGLIYILGSTDCYLTDDYDEDDLGRGENVANQEEIYSNYDNEITKNKRDPAFTPYISVGALSNIQQFFEHLKDNFKSLESLTQEERKALMGKQELPTDPETTRVFRPPATAAFLHAVRNQRPSNRMKHFVAKVEPSSYRGANHHSPATLWAGVGRRRRR